jgi:hypothetical protein
LASLSDARQFDREISRLIREAAAAEADDVARLLREITAVQSNMRQVLLSGDDVATMIARMEVRLSTLEQSMTRMFVDAVPGAVVRGSGMVDAGLAAVGVPAATPAVVDVGTGPALTLRSVAHQQVADLQQKVVYSITRLTGPNPAGLDDVLRAVGGKLQGSQVFGGPAARSAGALRAVLGDVTGAAMTERSNLIAAAGGQRTLKRWVHQGARNPRSAHVAAASRYRDGIPWDEKFRVGSYRTPHPRGPGLPGPQRFGCHCQVAPVLSKE